MQLLNSPVEPPVI